MKWLHPVLQTLLAATSYALSVQQFAPAQLLTSKDLMHLRDELEGAATASAPLSLGPSEVAQLYACLLITWYLEADNLLDGHAELRATCSPERLEAANTFLRDGLPDDLRALHPPRLSPPAQARSSA